MNVYKFLSGKRKCGIASGILVILIVITGMNPVICDIHGTRDYIKRNRPDIERQVISHLSETEWKMVMIRDQAHWEGLGDSVELQ